MLNSSVSIKETSFNNKIQSIIVNKEVIDFISPVIQVPIDEAFIEVLKKSVHLLDQSVSPLGQPELVESLISLTHKTYGYLYESKDEVLITAGLPQAFFTSINAFVKEGDQVVVLEPANPILHQIIEMNGGIAVPVRLNESDEEIKWDEIQKNISPQTRMIIMSNPGFGVGRLFTDLDLIRLQRIINGTKIILLCDETFQHFIYDGETHQSLSLFPKLAEQSILVASLSEPCFASGLRLAYCLAPVNLMKELHRVHLLIQDGVSGPGQFAVAKWLLEGNYKMIASEFQRKRDLFNEAIKDSLFKPSVTPGGIFEVLSFTGQSRWENDKEFALFLAEELSIATLPMSLINFDKGKQLAIRINFARPDDVLIKAAEALCRLS